MHSFHIVHNVGKAAEQYNDHAFGKLYISLTEADILPVGEEKNVHQLQQGKIQFMQTSETCTLDDKTDLNACPINVCNLRMLQMKCCV